jgi:hypothetical protein
LHFSSGFHGTERKRNPATYLIGPGAPADPIYIGGREETEGFDATHLVAGKYRLDMKLGSEVIGSQGFDLIERVAPGNQHELVIDPAQLAGRLFIARDMIELTVAADATADRRVSIGWTLDGTVKGVVTEWARGPEIGGGGELYTIDTIEDTRNIFPYEAGHHEIAAVSNGVVLGSWSFDIPPRNDGDCVHTRDHGWKGFDQIYTLPKDCTMTAIPHRDPDAKRAIAAAREAERQAEGASEHKHYSEQTVCAVAADPKANELLRQLHSGRDALRRAGVASAGAFDTLSDAHVTQTAAEEAHRTIGAVHDNQSAGERVLAKIAEQLQVIARHYPRGCLASYVPRGAVIPH